MLLLAVLTLVPFHANGPAPTPGGQSGRTAIQPPAAVLGIAAGLVVAATVVWLAMATLLPRPPVPHPSQALAPLALAAAGLVLLKLLLDPDRLANGAWLSLGLAGVLVGAQFVRPGRSAPG